MLKGNYKGPHKVNKFKSAKIKVFPKKKIGAKDHTPRNNLQFLLKSNMAAVRYLVGKPKSNCWIPMSFLFKTKKILLNRFIITQYTYKNLHRSLYWRVARLCPTPWAIVPDPTLQFLKTFFPERYSPYLSFERYVFKTKLAEIHALEFHGPSENDISPRLGSYLGNDLTDIAHLRT